MGTRIIGGGGTPANPADLSNGIHDHFWLDDGFGNVNVNLSAARLATFAPADIVYLEDATIIKLGSLVLHDRQNSIQPYPMWYFSGTPAVGTTFGENTVELHLTAGTGVELWVQDFDNLTTLVCGADMAFDENVIVTIENMPAMDSASYEGLLDKIEAATTPNRLNLIGDLSGLTMSNFARIVNQTVTTFGVTLDVSTLTTPSFSPPTYSNFPTLANLAATNNRTDGIRISFDAYDREAVPYQPGILQARFTRYEKWNPAATANIVFEITAGMTFYDDATAVAETDYVYRMEYVDSELAADPWTWGGGTDGVTEVEGYRTV